MQMTCLFNSRIEKVLPQKGQWAYRQRVIIVGGIAFTLKENLARVVTEEDLGRKVSLSYYPVSYKSKTDEDRYYTYLIITEITFDE